MAKDLTWVELSESALANNIASIRAITSGASRPLLCVPVKANAYGHGLPEMVRLLRRRPVDYLAAHSLDEARIARRAKWRKPILMVGYVARDNIEEALKLNVEMTVYDPGALSALASAARKQRMVAQVHLKVETGANRQGVRGRELQVLLETIKSSRTLRLRGLSTHFANIEDTTDHTFARMQLKRFRTAINLCKKVGVQPDIRHTAASAAHLVVPETRYDMIRPGIAVYGHWPSRETLLSFRHLHPETNGTRLLQPVMSLKSRIAQIKRINKGDTVGYGRTFRAERAMRIAIAPLGYYDGLPRAMSGVGHVLINGRRAPLLGRVSMNNIVFDITGLRGVNVEDEIVALGKSGSEEITAEQIAQWSGTINYEALTRIGAHLPRVITP